MISSSLSLHASMVQLRTKERCTPRLRWMPEHSMHRKMPYDTDAHCAFLRPQSTHDLLSGMRNCAAKKDLAMAARSARLFAAADALDVDMRRDEQRAAMDCGTRAEGVEGKAHWEDGVE